MKLRFYTGEAFFAPDPDLDDKQKKKSHLYLSFRDSLPVEKLCQTKDQSLRKWSRCLHYEGEKNERPLDCSKASDLNKR